MELNVGDDETLIVYASVRDSSSESSLGRAFDAG